MLGGERSSADVAEPKDDAEEVGLFWNGNRMLTIAATAWTSLEC